MAWVESAIKCGIAQKIWPQNPLSFVMNKAEMSRVVQSLHEAFPPTFFHAFACKANGVLSVLSHLKDCNMGCETASLGEFTQAQKVFPTEKIVFDSPCKTLEELKYVCYTNCYVNLDNFQELERVIALDKEKPVTAIIGLRINPQLGEGAIGCTSTGMATSKFGIGLQDAKNHIIEAFHQHKFLKMLHIHTGSQGIGFKMMTEGVKSLHALAEEVGPQVTTIDIGGGLPVNFSSDEYTPTFKTYSELLQAEVPGLFDGKRKVITEFGRAVAAKAGILASRVEYTKVNGGRRIVLQHAGVDLLIRTVWAPAQWPLRVNFFDGSSGALRTEDPGLTDVAGPCCLGGDLACRERMLPQAQPGDMVAIYDVGAYFHSAWSHYNLRTAPGVYWYDEEKKAIVEISKPGTLEQVQQLFS